MCREKLGSGAGNEAICVEKSWKVEPVNEAICVEKSWKVEPGNEAICAEKSWEAGSCCWWYQSQIRTHQLTNVVIVKRLLCGLSFL